MTTEQYNKVQELRGKLPTLCVTHNCLFTFFVAYVMITANEEVIQFQLHCNDDSIIEDWYVASENVNEIENVINNLLLNEDDSENVIPDDNSLTNVDELYPPSEFYNPSNNPIQPE